MAKKGWFMSDDEFKNTDWKKVFEDFKKLDAKTQEKINKQALKRLEKEGF